MIRIHLERDPALVTSATLRIRTRRHAHYLWRAGWRLHYARSERY